MLNPITGGIPQQNNRRATDGGVAPRPAQFTGGANVFQRLKSQSLWEKWVSWFRSGPPLTTPTPQQKNSNMSGILFTLLLGVGIIGAFALRPQKMLKHTLQEPSTKRAPPASHSKSPFPAPAKPKRQKPLPQTQTAPATSGSGRASKPTPYQAPVPASPVTTSATSVISSPTNIVSRRKAHPVTHIFTARSVEDRKLGAMLGLACGDAFGAPFEGAATEALPKNITLGLRGGAHNKFYQNYKYLPGETTDDTLFAKLTQDLLFEYKQLGKNLSNRAIRTAFYQEYMSRLSHYMQNGAQGFGDTTIKAIERFRNNQQGNIFSFVSNNMIGNGNAPILRSIPLALDLELDDALMDKMVDEFVQITHRATATPGARKGDMRTPLEQDLRATVAATRASCKIIRRMLRENIEVTDKEAIKKIYTDVAKEIKTDSPETAKLIANIVNTSSSPNYEDSILRDHIPTVASGKYRNKPDAQKRELYNNELRGVSGESWNTLRVSLWALLHHEDTGVALLDIVRKGGDTDSNAAFAGALFGVAEGQGGIPWQLDQGLLRKKFNLPPSHQAKFNERSRKGYLIYRDEDNNIKITSKAFT